MSDQTATPPPAGTLGAAQAIDPTRPEEASTPPAEVPELVAGPVTAAAAAAIEPAATAAGTRTWFGQRERLIGFLLVLGATLGWSLSGLFMRLLEEPDPWRSNGWRGLSMALAMALYLLLRHGRRLPALLAATPPQAVALGGGCFAVGSSLYLVSLTLAPVADVAALGATAPLFAALFAWLTLREPTPRAVLGGVAVAVVGVGLMVADTLALSSDAWQGQAVAIVVAAAFAGQTVALRRFRGVEMMPAFVVGGLLVAAIMLSLAEQPLPSRHDLLLIALMGVVQLAIPIALYARGARYLPATQLALFALLDVVLNPLWAWLGVGEVPTLETAIGSALIVGAVALVALRRR